jgi:hypothetical protein
LIAMTRPRRSHEPRDRSAARRARALRRALAVLTRALPAAALLCPGHWAHTVQRTENTPAQHPTGQGPAAGHPERMAAHGPLSADEMLWRQEIHTTTR